MAQTPSLTSRIPTSVRVVNLAITLVLVGGITWVATILSVPAFEGGRLTVLMGFVLLAASLAGGLAATAGLPRLTGFLLVGIIAGPSVLGVLPAPAV